MMLSVKIDKENKRVPVMISLTLELKILAENIDLIPDKAKTPSPLYMRYWVPVLKAFSRSAVKISFKL